jgi:hypothetical protein
MALTGFGIVIFSTESALVALMAVHRLERVLNKQRTPHVQNAAGDHTYVF